VLETVFAEEEPRDVLSARCLFVAVREFDAPQAHRHVRTDEASPRGLPSAND